MPSMASRYSGLHRTAGPTLGLCSEVGRRSGVPALQVGARVLDFETRFGMGEYASHGRVGLCAAIYHAAACRTPVARAQWGRTALLSLMCV